MRRTKAEAEQTRSQLLDTALRLFDEKGYQATTLSEIATESGMTRGALYWHFKNKADILIALADTYFTPCIERFTAISNVNIWAQLIDFYQQLFADIEANPEYIRVIRIFNTQELQHSGDPQVSRFFLERKASWRERLRELINQAINNGELPKDTDPDLAFLQIEITMTGIMCTLTQEHLPISVRPYIQQLITQTLISIRGD